jgi:hypothetical protein
LDALKVLRRAPDDLDGSCPQWPPSRQIEVRSNVVAADQIIVAGEGMNDEALGCVVVELDRERTVAR